MLLVLVAVLTLLELLFTKVTPEKISERTENILAYSQ